jgi:hypothetical protein
MNANPERSTHSPMTIEDDGRIRVASISSQKDEDTLTIGLVDSDEETPRHVLLSVSLQPTEQERRIGIDDVHLEWLEQSRSGYGLIASWNWYGDDLVIGTRSDARSLGIPATIVLIDALRIISETQRDLLDAMLAGNPMDQKTYPI